MITYNKDDFKGREYLTPLVDAFFEVFNSKYSPKDQRELERDMNAAAREAAETIMVATLQARDEDGSRLYTGVKFSEILR